MLTPEQIKKLIEIAKPEGFNCYEDIDGLTLVIGIRHETLFIDNNMVLEEVFYPLFLQKCIEGVNRGYRDNIQDRYFIDTDAESIDVWDEDDRTYPFCGNFRDYGTIDQAKEQALIYILDNIQKQD